MRYSLPLLIILVLYACANPAKLLEQGKYNRALEVSSWQLKHGRIKAKELSALETAFYLVSQQDSQAVADLRNTNRPEVWPEIYQKAIIINNRQHKIRALQAELEQADYSPHLDFYPAKSLLVEAAEKSALYHYANAQQYIPSARGGDRHAARHAFDELGKSLNYIEGFKDVFSLQLEMKELGTTHLLLNFVDGPRYYDPSLLDNLLWGYVFPIEKDWIVIHKELADAPTIHFEMDVYFDQLYVSRNREDCSTCTNSVEVEDGFITKKVWSAKDSAYVEVKEQQYKTVSATVTTIVQSKEASASLQMTLYDATNGQQIDKYQLIGSEDWSNEYSSYTGDSRALTISCSGASGICSMFPADSSLLDDAIEDLRYEFWQYIRQVENY